MIVRDLINRGEAALRDHGVPNARRNSEWILGHVLDCKLSDLYIFSHRSLGDKEQRRFEHIIERRAGREPLQYLLGSTEFMGFPFLTHPGVFIPRQETELLVEHTENRIAAARWDRAPRVLDLCSGSGVIAVSLLKRLPTLRAVALDKSTAAVELTAKNAYRNNVIDRLQVLSADALDYAATTEDRFHAVVSNPPYISERDEFQLPPEVREHEPRLSLFGGEDGLAFYRQIIPLLPRLLVGGGLVAFEIGADQAEFVSAQLRLARFRQVDVQRDYAGFYRIVSARFPDEGSDG